MQKAISIGDLSTPSCQKKAIVADIAQTDILKAVITQSLSLLLIF
jgi:hypothetical protein